MEQNDHDYLAEMLAKVYKDEMLYGNGFLHFSEGTIKHLPAEEVLKELAVEVDNG